MQKMIYCLIFILVACAEKVAVEDMTPIDLRVRPKVDMPVKTEISSAEIDQLIQWLQEDSRYARYQDQREKGLSNIVYDDAIARVAKKFIQSKNSVLVLDDNHFLVIDGSGSGLQLYQLKDATGASSSRLATLHLKDFNMGHNTVMSYGDGLLALANLKEDQVILVKLDLMAEKSQILTEEWCVRLLDIMLTKPVVAGGEVYAYGRSNKLYKLDAVTGKTIWIALMGEQNVAGEFRLAPLVYKQSIIAFSTLGQVTAFDRKSAKILWQLNENEDLRIDSPLSMLHQAAFSLQEQNILYFSGANRGIYAVNLDTGKLLWQRETLVDGPLIAWQGQICFFSGENLLICLSKHDGEPTLWHRIITDKQVK